LITPPVTTVCPPLVGKAPPVDVIIPPKATIFPPVRFVPESGRFPKPDSLVQATSEIRVKVERTVGMARAKMANRIPVILARFAPIQGVGPNQ
jgi:hypothetical protein